MKVLCCGAFRLSGTSKAGSQFDMCVLKVLRQAESFDNEKLHCRAYGYESVDLPLDHEVLPQFSELRYPVMLNLTLDQKMTRKGVETFVVGFDPKAKGESLSA